MSLHEYAIDVGETKFRVAFETNNLYRQPENINDLISCYRLINLMLVAMCYRIYGIESGTMYKDRSPFPLTQQELDAYRFVPLSTPAELAQHIRQKYNTDIYPLS